MGPVWIAGDGLRSVSEAVSWVFHREGGRSLTRGALSLIMSQALFPYALAAIDIDDTLVGPDKRIGPANRRAVARLQERGCRVVLASGRRHLNMLPYCEELGLDDFVVSSQGARVEHARTGEVIHRASVAPGEVLALVEEGLRRGFHVMLWLAEGVYADAHAEWVDRYLEETRDDPVTIGDLGPLASRPAEKVIWSAAAARIDEAAVEMRGRLAGRLSATITLDWALEFTAQEANKDNGVSAVARHFGIARDAVLAFGDSNNDVTMLAWAGLGVAMPHGRPAALSAAHLVGRDGDPESALARAVDQVMEGCLV